MYQASKKHKVGKMKPELGAPEENNYVCVCPYCPTFNNQPSTFAKFARWWEFAQT
jgi:hypothetical protein